MFRKKRIIAIVLSLMMVASALPGIVSGAEVTSKNLNYVQVPEASIDYPTYPTEIRWQLGPHSEATAANDIRALKLVNLEDMKIKVDPAYNSPETGYKNYIINEQDSLQDINFTYNLSGEKCGLKASDIDAVITQNLGCISVCEVSSTGKETEVASAALNNLAAGTIKIPGSGHDAGSGGNGGGGGNNKWPGFDLPISISHTALEPGKDYVLVFDKAIAGKSSAVNLGCDIRFYFSTSPIKTTSIKLDQTATTLKEGQKMILKAVVKPGDATNKAVTWTSSNSKTAAVDASGKVIAKSAGNATITATTKDGTNLKAICRVKVTPVIAKVSAKAASIGYNSVKVSWSNAPRVSGYTVYKYNSKIKKYKAVKNTGKRSYTDKKLKTGSTCAYKVRAYRIIDNKKVYGQYSSKTAAKPRPSTPKLKMNAAKGKAVLKWSNISGATKYELYKTTKKNEKFYKERITVRTKYTDTSLKKGKNYYYKVRAYRTVSGKKVYSGYSNVVKVKAK